MAENKIKERSEIEEQYKWDLSPLYESDEAWEKDLPCIDECVKELVAYEGKLTKSPAVLKEFYEKNNAFERKLSNIYEYTMLRKSEDNRAEAAQVMSAKAMGKLYQAIAQLSFVDPELLSMSDEKFDSFVNAPELAEYKHLLEDLKRSKAHTLTQAEEKILSGMGEIKGAPGDIADALQDADLKFDPIINKDGEEMEVSGANYILLQENSDRDIREKAFRSFYKTYKEHINTFTATYSSNVKGDAFMARTRNYNSAREMSMSQNNIPESVYDSLVETVHDCMPAMYRYVALRKKMLGVDELHYYDVYAPLVGDLDLKYSWDEAKEMVKTAVKPLGEEYGKNVQRAFDERWVDVFPNTGKSGGAYSAGTYDSNPYIMMNFTGTLDSVSTIAHEMGHSQHTLLSSTHQPSHYADYTLFVAEIASTVNENLLIEQLLKQDIDDKTRMYLLNQYMENFKGTVFRQTMFAEFEKLAHEEVEKGGALSSEWLCKTYEDLVKLYFGPDMVMDEEVRYEWARIPHFYRSFYVYVYATGYCSAAALSEAILKEGDPAVKRYLEFLSMGGSQYPLDELKHAGVDLTTPAPIAQALKKFESIVKDAEETYARLTK